MLPSGISSNRKLRSQEAASSNTGLCVLHQKTHHTRHTPSNHNSRPSIIQLRPLLLQPPELLLFVLILPILQPLSNGCLLLVHWHHDEQRPRRRGDVGCGRHAQVRKLRGSDGMAAAVEVCDDGRYEVRGGAGGVERGKEILAAHISQLLPDCASWLAQAVSALDFLCPDMVSCDVGLSGLGTTYLLWRR
jgi:hypothetical protein